jgi:hypothetical protein
LKMLYIARNNLESLSAGALRSRTLLPEQLAPLPGSLTRPGAQKTVSLGHSVLRFNC